MNAVILVNGADVTDAARLSGTRINYDSTRRISTGAIELMGQSPGELARYDEACYDEAVYALDVAELYTVTILDGRDRLTKLFEGHIYSIDLAQSDSPSPEVFYRCTLSDYAAWLDRSVCWDPNFSVPMPCLDTELIAALVGRFCPRIAAAHLTPLFNLMDFEWLGKSLRQVLDDVCAMTLGEWRVDYGAELWYGPMTAAPPAPYGLSTSPDYVTTFPVRVDQWTRDFTNPVNVAYIRGAVKSSGVPVQAEFRDPVSIATYGEYHYAEVDEQITETYDAELRAKTTVLKYSYPLEEGTFVVWTDDLQPGQLVEIREDALGIDGAYAIRALALEWKDNYTVEYTGQFGAMKADLEAYLRMLDARSRWKSARPQASIPAAGSITDAHIAPPGLTAAVIQSVNANGITGLIQAGQIGGVNAGAIVGLVQSEQIGTVNAVSIQGAIQAGQIGAVNATVIQGVVVSSQLADGIIDELGKYADALRPIPIVTTFPALPSDNHPPNSYFHNSATGRFYKVTPDGLAYTDQGSNPDALTGRMSFYHIGQLHAKAITGLIVAAQIDTILAGQITGMIQAAQIGAVNASTIQGGIQASQIVSVSATAIEGAIQANQIASINAGSITGTIQGSQIANINAGTITIGLIADNQIGNISGAKLIVGTVQSDKLDTYAINVGGGSGKPGRIIVYDGAPVEVARIGNLDNGYFGGWFKLFGAGGTGYSTSKVYTDNSGNLFIRDADFRVTVGAHTISTSTTSFDSTYSTLALVANSGAQKTSLISRGLVTYEGSTKIGYLGRSPGGAYAEIELSGSSYIYLGAGRVRADGGFAVGGEAGVAYSYVEFLTTGGASWRFDLRGGIVTRVYPV